MSMHRDNSPEQSQENERLQARSWLVESAALEAEASLYGEFTYIWGKPAEPIVAAAKPAHGAANVIDRAFIEAQNSQLASDQAVREAQRNVLEALDEFSA
jgi:hypothetical protein